MPGSLPCTTAGARPVLLYASLACADLLHLADEIGALEQAGIDGFHYDMADGHFVPNFGLSLELLRQVRRTTRLPITVHLMVMHPERYIERVVEAGASAVVVHQESTPHLHRALEQIRSAGAHTGVALNPATPVGAIEYVLDSLDVFLIMTVDPGFSGQRLVPATMHKISEACAYAARLGVNYDVAVDGNVSFDHAPAMVRAGANVLVAGTSSVFASGHAIAEAVARLRATAGAPLTV